MVKGKKKKTSFEQVVDNALPEVASNGGREVSVQFSSTSKKIGSSKNKKGKKSKVKAEKEEELKVADESSSSSFYSEDEEEEIRRTELKQSLAALKDDKKKDKAAPVPGAAKSAKEKEAEKIKELKFLEEKYNMPKSMRKKRGTKPYIEMMEKLRIEAEEEEKRLAELERIRIQQETEAAILREKREREEQLIREKMLVRSSQKIKDLEHYWKTQEQTERDEREWQIYLTGGKKPNPSKTKMMNTYLHLWDKVISNTSIEEAAKRTHEVLDLLDKLDDYMEQSPYEENQMNNWKWVRSMFRERQKQSLNIASYLTLRNFVENLKPINLEISHYEFKDEFMALYLWMRVPTPTPLPNPRRPPKSRVTINISVMDMEITFPLSVDFNLVAFRGKYLKYDHYSSSWTSFEEAPDHTLEETLYEATMREWRAKRLYKYKCYLKSQREKAKPPEVQDQETEPNSTKTEETEPEEDFSNLEEIPSVPFMLLEPSPEEYVLALEEESYANARGQNLDGDPDMLNMRRYSVIGGVYELDLVELPPQPLSSILFELNLSALSLPKELKYVDFYIEYNPPKPPPEGVMRTPEQIEEEMKKQEEELDKLLLITLTWPQHVIFIEPPIVSFWDEKQENWTIRDVFDLKHNEEKGVLTFRTGRLGTIGLACNRYAHLPYQTWDLHPEENGSVTLQITTTLLILEFNLKGCNIALTQLQNSPNMVLQDMLGTYFPFPKLKKLMKEAGIDVFPPGDALCYVEGSSEKHWPMEQHVYYNMALTFMKFNYSWSRWNAHAGRRKIVMQLREYSFDKPKQKQFMMILVTPLRASVIDCTEVSQTFNEREKENSKFCCDLYNLVKYQYPLIMRNYKDSASKETVLTLANLLKEVRLFGFS